MGKQIKYNKDIESREWLKFSMSEKMEFFRQAHIAMMSSEKPYNLIGERIGLLRCYYDYSQVQLAKIAGVDRSTIIGYETKGKTPSLKNLEAVANALCGVDKFVTHFTKESLEDYRKKYTKKSNDDNSDEEDDYDVVPIDMDSKTFGEFSIELHKLFNKYNLYYRYNGGHKFMTEGEKQLLLKQIDATLDFTEDMLMKSPKSIRRKK